MAKPTFLFVPGAWSTPAVFDLLTTALTTHEYRTQTISLPSVGANPGLHDFSADVTAVREAVTTLANEGKDVIVVMHSYGGMPGSEALEGLGKEEREAKGKTGGVVRLVYIMSYAVPEGWQFTERGNLDPFPEWQDIDAKVSGSSVFMPFSLPFYRMVLLPSLCSSFLGKRNAPPFALFIVGTSGTY